MRLADLSLEDLARCPIWRLTSNEEPDGAQSIEPSPEVKELRDPIGDDPVYIVRTRFILADRSVLFGYCSPADPSGLDYVQPVIVHGRRHIPLFDETRGELVPLETVATALGRLAADVAPISYEALILLDGECVRETLTWDR